ncbi:nucleoside diphosphate-linked moiety X motif 19-like [Anopheles stephensi]|uniref:nucleoside diphosphate-linked moiety X motif 19-like n=1 Tax=Anopheles stephensi TaxID=30069 RepID=UPI0016588912|nr:nucleoside diphosphate-linked moiety X motif 19-like [Anopheles stephensi]
MRKYAKYWRDSASVIVVARNRNNELDEHGYNYKVLVFKRTEKTSFLPNHIVFPGGSFDAQDDSLDWLKLFAKQSIPPEALETVSAISGPRPYIFCTTEDDLLDRNISMRLCALRECFEELGVLLVTNKGPPDGYSAARHAFDVRTWQTDVHDGRKQFRELYEQLQEAPDLWSLYEWSTWITPTHFGRKRFETAFFLAALNEIPPVFPEKHEVDEYMWQSPKQILAAHSEGTLWLAPPQAYELHRLSYVHDIDVLVRFAKARNRLGCTSFCPVAYNASDGFIGVLPGDDLYPTGFDFITDNEEMNKYGELTMKELADMARNVHRVEHRGLHSQTYLHNGPSVDRHLHVLGNNRELSKL